MQQPSLHRLAFDGALLARGFWLYIWEITTKDGSKIHYVGRTGDSSSLHAQSPFARISQHLGRNANANALRRNLENHELVAEECRAFRLFACGPLFPESHGQTEHTQSRDIVAALEKQLADSMRTAGYRMLNEVKCHRQFDLELWRSIVSVFTEPFPNLQSGAAREES